MNIVPRGRAMSWLENMPRRYWGKPLIDLAFGKRLERIAEILSAAGSTPSVPNALELISFNHETGDRWLIAPSLAAWLSDLVQELKEGKLCYEAARGLVEAAAPGDV